MVLPDQALCAINITDAHGIKKRIVLLDDFSDAPYLQILHTETQEYFLANIPVAVGKNLVFIVTP